MLLWLGQRNGTVASVDADVTGYHGGISPEWIHTDAGISGQDPRAIASLLRSMDRDGLIGRELSGKRTLRVWLTDEGRAAINGYAAPLPPPSPAPAPPPTSAPAASSDEPATASSNGQAPAPVPTVDPGPAPALEHPRPAAITSRLTDADVAYIARALLDQAVAAIADTPTAKIDELTARLGQAVAEAQRLRDRLRESADHNAALSEQLGAARHARRQAQDQLTSVLGQLRTMPEPPDERSRRMLERLMRERPVSR